MRSATTFVVGISCLVLLILAGCNPNYQEVLETYKQEVTALEASLVKANEQIATLSTELKNTKKRLQETARHLDEERLRASQERIRLLTAHQETVNAYLQLIEQASMDAAERFGALGPMERRQAARAFEAVSAGTATLEQECIAEQFAPPQLREKIKQARIERAEKECEEIYGQGYTGAGDPRSSSNLFHRNLIKHEPSSEFIIPPVKGPFKASFKELPSP